MCHSSYCVCSHEGGGGGVPPILVIARRMAEADETSTYKQSDLDRMLNSFGIADLARGPRCPKDTATHARTESSGLSSSETMSASVLSSTSCGSILCVSCARCSAAVVRVSKAPSVRTWAIVSWSRLVSTEFFAFAAPKSMLAAITQQKKRIGANWLMDMIVSRPRMRI